MSSCVLWDALCCHGYKRNGTKLPRDETTKHTGSSKFSSWPISGVCHKAGKRAGKAITTSIKRKGWGRETDGNTCVSVLYYAPSTSLMRHQTSLHRWRLSNLENITWSLCNSIKTWPTGSGTLILLSQDFRWKDVITEGFSPLFSYYITQDKKESRWVETFTHSSLYLLCAREYKIPKKS